MACESSHRQHVNKGAWLQASKNQLTRTGDGLDLAHGLQFWTDHDSFPEVGQIVAPKKEQQQKEGRKDIFCQRKC